MRAEKNGTVDQIRSVIGGSASSNAEATSPQAASRALAIANALDGMTRAEAARVAGMKRQASHGAATRYNVKGSTGLRTGEAWSSTGPEQG